MSKRLSNRVQKQFSGYETCVADRNKHIQRLHFLLRKLKKAQRLWGLFDSSDSVLLGLSGGKDSIVLMHLLLHWQRNEETKFSFSALHVLMSDSQERKQLLASHARALGVDLHFIPTESSNRSDAERNGAICFRCAWNRRRELFRFAHENGFNKVALAHHLDDAVETALMNLVFHANLETMEPKVEFFDGAVTLIRPLILAEEREIARLGATLAFPYFDCLCPADHRTQRDHVKQIIRSFGKRAAKVKKNIWKASRTWPENQMN